MFQFTFPYDVQRGMDMLYIVFFGGLVLLFLLGMTWMRIGLFNLSGSKMEEWMKRATSTPFKGMIAGIAITAILQSSSAVTVITVGLVSARILSFPQTIGIILGTNIGTTITLQFFTFDLTDIIIPLLVLGTICILFKNPKLRSSGFIFIGIGCIFTAMNSFEWLANSLENIPFMDHVLSLMQSNIVYSFLLGIALTALIQSSTIVTGIAMSFLATGIYPLEMGIAIMLGANIGTCTTALLGSIGAGPEARLTAFAHLWLNIVGALLFFPLIPLLATFSTALSQYPDSQLAHASVIYNVLCSLIVLPFAKPFGRLMIWLHSKE